MSRVLRASAAAACVAAIALGLLVIAHAARLVFIPFAEAGTVELAGIVACWVAWTLYQGSGRRRRAVAPPREQRPAEPES